MQKADRRTARVLIVDDLEGNVRLLTSLLRRAGYSALQGLTDSRLVLSVFQTFHPDLILLDLHMPHLDGLGVLEQLRPHVSPDTYLPVIMLTTDASRDAKQAALSLGARDFVTKPFDSVEVLLRIENLLEARHLHQQLAAQNGHLEDLVRARTRALEESQQDLLATQAEILGRLATATEYRDDATGDHARRVAEMAHRMALAVGLPADEAELIGQAALLHDVGKIGIPDRLLLKAGRLTPEEFEEMKTHTTIGAHIVSGSRSRLVQMVEEVALTHHERWDGSGYSPGTAGEEIPLAGRIVAVADVFDALTHERPYKPAWPVAQATAEILAQRGRQFDPAVVDAFMTLVPSQSTAPV
jgi:putative two-component system response regulator